MSVGGSSRGREGGVVFRLLGAIDAEIDGRVLDLGHVRQRAVLAVLLVEANSPVPPDQLVDRIWGDRPPQRASATVYSYLSRLRRSLAGVEGVELVRRAGGYVLRVEPMAVDLHRFRQLAAAARNSHGETALSLFDQALGLWRGQPFAGADIDWLNRAGETALRERLAVELDRNDLALAIGRHADVLADLQTLAHAHPLDERVAAQLMVALYRSGRQAQAQHVFDRVRRRLAEDLGTDPGPLLRQAQQQILAGEQGRVIFGAGDGGPAEIGPDATGPGGGHRPGPAAARGWLAVPRQLPAPPSSFAGRAELLADLDRAMAPAADGATTVVISAIGGSGGVGKTWLALKWAHANIWRFPDGQLYVNLRGFDSAADPLPAEVAVRGFLEALGVPDAAVPAHLDAQSALFRSLTAGKRVLVMLDNARDSSHVLALLPGAPSCTVMVTSRRSLAALVAGHGARPVAVGVLSDDEARDLLVGHLGAGRVAGEPDAVRALIDHCGGLPLALGIVAARAMTHPDAPLAALADEVRSASSRLDALDAGELSVNLRAVLSCSCAALSVPAAALFALLGAAPGPDIGLHATASLLDTSIDRARASLSELINSHLLNEPSPGRYRMHDLVRLYAVELAQRSGDAQATTRVLDHYLTMARAADGALNLGHPVARTGPVRSHVDTSAVAGHAGAMAWFTAEQQVLVSAVELAAATGHDAHAWQLALALEVFLARRPDWSNLLTTQSAAVKAARRLGDPRALTYAHRGLGIAYIGLRRFDEAHAHLSAALEPAVALDDVLCLAHLHRSLGRLHAQQSRFADALPHDEQALEFFRAAGDVTGQATALNAIGWHLAHLGDSAPAMDRCRQALSLYERLGDLFGQALTWDSLGYVHRDLGDHSEAVSCYRHAVKLLQELGHRGVAASCLVDLGQAYLLSGDPPAAGEAWREALQIYEEFSDPAADRVRDRLRQVTP